MNKLLLIVSCLLICASPVLSQERSIDQSFSQDSIFAIPDETATYPGGQKELIRFLAQTIRYPETALENGLEGRVDLRFIIEKDGSVGEVQVLRGIPGCPECDREAVRVVRLMPGWDPARVDGNPVRSYFILPVNYKMAKFK